MKLKSNQPNATAEKVVKDIRRATRLHYSTEVKFARQTNPIETHRLLRMKKLLHDFPNFYPVDAEYRKVGNVWNNSKLLIISSQ